MKYVCLLLLIAGGYVFANPADSDKYKDDFKFKNVYDSTANAELDIQNAIKAAKAENKRVLLMFGANWCPWCQRLHHLIETNAQVNRYLHEHYELVLVDLGKRDRNMQIDKRYGSPNKLGIPAFVVLDSNGKQIHTQETGALEYPKGSTKKGHDPDKVMRFLRQWATK